MTDDIDDVVPKQPPPFRLDRADLNSSCWAKLKKHMEGQQEKLRRQNDSDLDPVKTAKLRGRIAALRDLLALGSPDPASGADEEQPE